MGCTNAKAKDCLTRFCSSFCCCKIKNTNRSYYDNIDTQNLCKQQNDLVKIARDLEHVTNILEARGATVPLEDLFRPNFVQILKTTCNPALFLLSLYSKKIIPQYSINLPLDDQVKEGYVNAFKKKAIKPLLDAWRESENEELITTTAGWLRASVITPRQENTNLSSAGNVNLVFLSDQSELLSVTHSSINCNEGYQAIHMTEGPVESNILSRRETLVQNDSYGPESGAVNKWSKKCSYIKKKKQELVKNEIYISGELKVKCDSGEGLLIIGRMDLRPNPHKDLNGLNYLCDFACFKNRIELPDLLCHRGTITRININRCKFIKKGRKVKSKNKPYLLNDILEGFQHLTTFIGDFVDIQIMVDLPSFLESNQELTTVVIGHCRVSVNGTCNDFVQMCSRRSIHLYNCVIEGTLKGFITDSIGINTINCNDRDQSEYARFTVTNAPNWNLEQILKKENKKRTWNRNEAEGYYNLFRMCAFSTTFDTSYYKTFVQPS